MARKIAAMHEIFGRYTGKEPEMCKNCSNFTRHRYDKVYRKCTVYGESCSEATDWNASYEACGLFNKPYDGTSVIDLLKHSSKPNPDIPFKGQISINEWMGGD